MLRSPDYPSQSPGRFLGALLGPHPPDRDPHDEKEMGGTGPVGTVCE